MKKKLFHTTVALLALILLAGCSTSKNTLMSRRYHAMTTKFNIAFNGNVSYKEGMENIAKANKDDYSQIIHIYPISNHATATSAGGNMDRVIEKSRKAIKLHSIKKKPERDYRKMSDPKYLAWYNQNEYNPELKKVWLQLGRAEFHKGDFLGSVGTFSYITRYYASTPEIVQESQLWMVRAYSELNWLYEAEDLLKKIKKENVTSPNSGLYASAWADLLIKRHEYRQALSYLKTTLETEKNKKQRARLNFVMAQLLERTGDKQGAIEHYSRVISATPPYEMDFNARINRAQLLSKNPASIESELKRMAKNRNNKEYSDQIYTALGNIFLHEKDSAKAITYYNLAIAKSTRNGVEKGVSLVAMGDLYYKKRDYVKAHPYYDEASKIYTNEYEDFKRISYRAEALGALVKEYEIVHLQDSLQTLSVLPEKDRLKAIDKVIEKIKKDEKADTESKIVAQQNIDDSFTMPMQPLGVGAGDWYFYNPMNVSNGKTEFRRRWGNRKLEDNWRRANKSASLFAENGTSELTDSASITGNDTTGMADPNIPAFTQTSDKKSIDYYLAQIPFTQAQKEKSNEQIATGLYNMAFVYKDKIEDYPMAYNTFGEFQKRFDADERVLETLYQRFLLASKENNPPLANQFRNEILAQHADSKYAEMLADPDFIRNQQRMFEEQDFIYNKTYTAFTHSDYKTVFANTEDIKRKFPLSALLPQFEFLNTLSIGKTETSEKFEQSLNDLVENYPESNVSAMSKDILALLKQGNVAQHGKTHGSLLAKRNNEDTTPELKTNNQFSADKTGKHRLLLITDTDNKTINKLQYNLAIFNFSRFMIKDFGFSISNVNDTQKALSVNNLVSYDEGIWYIHTLNTDSALVKEINAMHVQPVIISEDNFGKLRTLFTLENYLNFEKDSLLKNAPQYLIAKTEKVQEAAKKPAQVQIIDGTKQTETPKENAITKIFGQIKDKASEVADAGKETLQTIVTQVNDKVKETTDTGKETAQSREKATAPEKNMDKKAGVTTQNTGKEQPKQPEKIAETAKTEQPKPATPAVQQPAEPVKTETANTIIVPANENLPKTTHKPDELYKNLYFYDRNAPHYTAFYIPSGGRFDFEKIKKALDEYNGANYKMMNLKVTSESFGKESVIFIGSFADANVAKSYFLRMLKEPTIVQATAGMNKRNLIATRDNLNTMLRNNAMNVYFEFMKEFYLAP